MAVQKFFVEGLAREDEARVESGLRELAGIIYAAANHADSCAEVEFEDDAVTTHEVREALQRMGFESRIAG
jgi:copper chaperone CopZ